MDGISPVLALLSQLAWLSGALASALGALWLTINRGRYGAARRALIAALGLTSIWAFCGASVSLGGDLTALFEALRNLAWIFALYRLFAFDNRHASVAAVRPMLLALAFVELLQAMVIGQIAVNGSSVEGLQPGFHTVSMLHVLTAVGGLVLIHNLFGGAEGQARLVLRWPALALALMWSYDLNHYAIGYLADDTPQVLDALRGVVGLPVGLFLVMGARASSDGLRFKPSRSITFQTASLLLIGGYLVTMVALAQWLAFSGGDFGQQLQFGFVALASIVAGLVLPSKRMRSWLRVTLTKHLFQHRYDYRAEWIRFSHTIARGGDNSGSIEERVIRAVADITDSPSGMLFTPGDDGRLELAARWQWPTADVPANAFEADTVRFFERQVYIADLDEIRAGRADRNLEFAAPEWLLAEPRAWALVPLLHYERLTGLVVLARPAQSRKLDWEDFDLLRVAGQQLASYLSEHAGQAALAEAGRFDDFHRRIAFVMHDIKNLASQFGLLARNAELHAENPEFRADMLITLRNSADKLNSLLSRLSRYGPVAVDALAPVRADEVIRDIAAQFEDRHPVGVALSEHCLVSAARHELEQVILHLVQNAVDASPPDVPVLLSATMEPAYGVIEVIDSGHGMSAEFVRSRLFRPFDSTKPGGFGIGAYEARELVKAMGGRLDVESREGLGTRFFIRLPRADAAEILKTLAPQRTTKTKAA
jgi:putative PEP-CTERM system histidine kinase